MVLFYLLRRTSKTAKLIDSVMGSVMYLQMIFFGMQVNIVHRQVILSESTCSSPLIYRMTSEDGQRAYTITVK